MWEEKVIHASDRVFPGLSYHHREKEFHEFGNQIKSSLPLQMALYFNVWAFPFWLVLQLGFLFEECRCLSKAYKYIHIGALLLVSVMEGTRLYFGYRGNLSEKIPELACFWLISTLLQFPLQLYVFCNERILPSVWQGVADGIVMILLIVEIIAGSVTLRNTANHYASKFYLAQLYGINDQFEAEPKRARAVVIDGVASF